MPAKESKPMAKLNKNYLDRRRFSNECSHLENIEKHWIMHSLQASWKPFREGSQEKNR
jgi:hypothetical protein